jgi:DNA-binding protein HU-beta
MVKEDLIQLIHDEVGLDTKKQSADTLDAILDSITEALAAGDNVALRNFGTFEVRHMAAKKGRNPQTGEPITIPEHNRPAFSPGKEFSERIRTSDSWNWNRITREIQKMRESLEKTRSEMNIETPEAREYYSRKIASYQRSYNELMGKLEGYAHAGGDAWREIRNGLTRAFDEVSDAFKRAADKF